MLTLLSSSFREVSSEISIDSEAILMCNLMISLVAQKFASQIFYLATMLMSF